MTTRQKPYPQPELDSPLDPATNRQIDIKPSSSGSYVERLEPFIAASPEQFFFPLSSQWGGVNEYVDDIISDANQLTSLSLAALSLGYETVFYVPYAYHGGVATGVERGGFLFFRKQAVVG